MDAELKKIIGYDIFRRYGCYTLPLKAHIKKSNELSYIITYRKANYYQSRNKLLCLYYRSKLKRLSYKTQFQIPIDTKIGKGLCIDHTGHVIINANAVLGDNIQLLPGVTIGEVTAGKLKGNPTIEDNVWIGTNAVIVGNIRVGKHSLIAPNSYVNFDVPAHSIVIGNQIHHKEFASKQNLRNSLDK